LAGDGVLSRKRLEVLPSVVPVDMDFPAADPPSAFSLRDLDGDGRSEVLAARRDALLVEIHGATAGSHALRGTVALPSGGPAVEWLGVAAGNLIGGELADVAVALGRPESGQVIIYENRCLEPLGTEFRRGDPDGSGDADITDAILVLQYLFGGRGDSLECADAADANDDGALDISDPVALLSYLFLGNAAPPAPGPFVCGADPTSDELSACGGTCG
jgi:hypothetical protein